MSDDHGVPDAGVDLSVSTWRQPTPPEAGPHRAAVLDRVAGLIGGLGDQRLRVAIDGFTAAGKTSLGHELAHRIAGRGRRVLRTSLDDFKRPWRDRHLYDRESGEGYYRNAFDADAARRLLLEPAAPGGDGVVALCSIDPITQIDHSSVTTPMPADGVLIVDGMFAFRPEIDHHWDPRIWVGVDAELSVRRGAERDAVMVGSKDAAEALARQRYLVAEQIYLAEVDPLSFVEVIIDNTDFARPRLVRPA
jgi:uridine kinase